MPFQLGVGVKTHCCGAVGAASNKRAAGTAEKLLLPGVCHCRRATAAPVFSKYATLMA